MKNVRALSIMYHDVVEGSAWDSSGFPGEAAASYKLSRVDFARHLDAIRAAVPEANTPLAQNWDLSPAVFFTFDDGGMSFHDPIARMLEERGWRGHFFITTCRIGTSAFLTGEQIRDLHRRGHVIGSHSATHPTRMALLSEAQLRQEWTQSVHALEDLLGEPVHVASVPGGYYSRTVGATAEQAGIRVLFCSEPTATVTTLGTCLLIGRYVVRRGMRPEISAAFAAGRFGPRFRQALEWKMKKVAKGVAGDAYLRVRRAVFGER